ncbi:MAG: potassium channel family protein [Desulfobulbia bacterium]
MLVAVTFALLNVLINWLVPDTFSNLSANSLPEQLSEFLYYSYITLNSLGYGDIYPTGSIARILAMLEVTFGVFYLAMLVASLVGIQISYKASKEESSAQEIEVKSSGKAKNSSNNES